jgi:hypothetical protein
MIGFGKPVCESVGGAVLERVPITASAEFDLMKPIMLV